MVRCQLMHLNKKTKIVCTIGPATESEAQLTKLLQAGMNVARLNFSHGDFAEHQNKLDNLKKAIKKTGIACATMQDLSGPKFRIGDFYKDRVELVAGEHIILTPKKIIGNEKKVSVTYPYLAKELKRGNMIMVDDGKKQLQVEKIIGKDVKCRIIVGGDTKGRRGINLPGAYLKVSSLTDKDKKDLAFGIKNKVDFVACSFVRTKADVLELKTLLAKAKSTSLVISKIETQEAVDNIDEIIAVSDALMVARGDLAVEIGAENVPTFQKILIKKCNEAGKPVITATQMLESMIKYSVPTRAEISDVANAIIDGTDAIMLSEETTLGDYPIEAVNVMTRVAQKTEEGFLRRQLIRDANGMDTIKSISRSTTSSAVKIANEIGATHILSLTNSGNGARLLSSYKPREPIFVFTPSQVTAQQIMLSYGCYPVLIKKFTDFDAAFQVIRAYMIKNKLASKNDKVVIATGVPFGKSKTANGVMVETL